MPAIAINGLGHNGRAALKLLQGVDGVSVAAVNELVPPDQPAYLLEHDLLGNDSVHGRWSKPVESEGDALVVDGRAPDT